MDWNEVLSDNRISIIEVADEVSPDSALAEFYTHKVRLGDKTPCILILDECQDFSMNSKSPLVKVLRQGAKQGIMAFLSTQYLSQDNGTDAVKNAVALSDKGCIQTCQDRGRSQTAWFKR